MNEGDRLLIWLCLACVACMICYSLGMKDGKIDTNKVWLEQMQSCGITMRTTEDVQMYLDSVKSTGIYIRPQVGDIVSKFVLKNSAGVKNEVR